ncbi:tetratricopeptide repeat protein [Solimonas variicoloris]|uniref:tetratricopeptide repeat protein n=1 Tax=Solimonas variicoloris TaxID=254408 RepID=UPI00037B1E69|nr:tetratricopeptide repeat protein [Solimonas variicoloris]
MKKAVTGLAAIGLALLAGCATFAPPAASDALFADERYGEPPAALQQLDLFALSPAMDAYLQDHIRKRAVILGHSRALFTSLTEDLRIDYDAAVTRTAGETFAAGAGNCLSLVILASAFAKRLDIPLRYQLVHGEGAWTRSGDLVFLNGHVNIVLDPHRRYGLTTGISEPGLVIDFAPARGVLSHDTEEVPERLIVAMFMNNRAAETLVAGDARQAYWWARASIRTAAFASAYNTLGVVYRRSGDFDRAEAALQRGLALAPRDAQLMNNLAGLYEQTRRLADAARLRARLARLAAYQPFQFLDAGYRAMAAGDVNGAMALYRRELEHIPYSAEVHYAIAVASARLGDARDAEQHLGEAMRLSTNLRDRDIYAGKLQRLQALQLN